MNHDSRSHRSLGLINLTEEAIEKEFVTIVRGPTPTHSVNFYWFKAKIGE